MAADNNMPAAHARNLFIGSPVFAAEWSVNPKPQPRASQVTSGAGLSGNVQKMGSPRSRLTNDRYWEKQTFRPDTKNVRN